MKQEQAGLYIHIPFCLNKCGYCSFYSMDSVHLISEYITALKKEIRYYRKIFSSFDTVYIGGGTPSLLAPRQLAEFLSAITQYYNLDKNAEITLEANPGDISLEYLKDVRSIGINRLNIGVQSFNDKILKLLGRRHSAKEAIAAIEAARKAGFNNLGLDLMYGVHGLGIQSWMNTLQQAVSFSPEHLSCYQLSLDEKTPLYKKYVSEGWHLPDENTELKLFLTTAEELENAGYMHYEVSNFARHDKFKSRHNRKYWRHIPYLGLGPASNSFLDNKRWWNKASVEIYIKGITTGKMAVEDSEFLSTEQLQLEALFLGLRTKEGINLKHYKTKYSIDLLADKKTVINALIKNKLVEIQNGFLRPTHKGMAVADSLALI